MGAQEDAEYSTQTFQMQFKDNPAPEEPHSYICSSVYNESESKGGARDIEISLWNNALIFLSPSLDLDCVRGSHSLRDIWGAEGLARHCAQLPIYSPL